MNNWTPNILNIPRVNWTAERNRSENFAVLIRLLREKEFAPVQNRASKRRIAKQIEQGVSITSYKK